MKIFGYLFIAGCTAGLTGLSSCDGSDSVLVVFKVENNLSELGEEDSSDVYVTGNLAELGNWNPSFAKMKQDGSGDFIYETEVPAGTSVEFKFTLGAWDREGTMNTRPGNDNFVLTAKHDTAISLVFDSWKSAVKESTLTGELITHELSDPSGEGTRIIRVLLPAGYQEYTEWNYPVLYMADGQNLFDEATSGPGGEWRIDEFLTEHSQQFPVIVVGIDNSSDRMEEYLDTPSGARYRNWVERVVVPTVDSLYRTIRDPSQRWVGGASAGGSVSFLLASRSPGIFGAALCFSPAIWVEGYGIDLISPFRSSTPAPFLFYVDMGGRGVDSLLIAGTDSIVRILSRSGWEETVDYLYRKDLEADHNEVAWARRFPGALKWIYDRSPVP